MTKESNLNGVNLGGGKAGGLSTTPTPRVPVDEDVYVSASKPYTFRLTIRTMKRLEVYCHRSKRGKGAVIDEAVEQWLAAQGEG